MVQLFFLYRIASIRNLVIKLVPMFFYFSIPLTNFIIVKSSSIFTILSFLYLDLLKFYLFAFHFSLIRLVSHPLIIVFNLPRPFHTLLIFPPYFKFSFFSQAQSLIIASLNLCRQILLLLFIKVSSLLL
jgi:hypothetical protein